MGSSMRRNKSALFDQCAQFCLRNCKYRLTSHAKMDLFAGLARKVSANLSSCMLNMLQVAIAN